MIEHEAIVEILEFRETLFGKEISQKSANYFKEVGQDTWWHVEGNSIYSLKGWQAYLEWRETLHLRAIEREEKFNEYLKHKEPVVIFPIEQLREDYKQAIMKDNNSLARKIQQQMKDYYEAKQ